ncbi:DUF4240 domain-containing protein [Nonomuraea sp. PA05]|uniref:DUF4240 domain-containing protein n=1 Tax=Nonomuraea sp. PA05 TaxID=2604466 RepID=UPI001652810F|nr:DUF4240 domain-containing protein [Nonomuraea sp. PA05]
MDIDGFWDVVERSATETGTRQARLRWLENHLAALPAKEIVDYATWFTTCRNRACTWDLYAACWLFTGRGSSNAFEYFTTWLISLGREDFEQAVGCPDRLLELPATRRLVELSRNHRHERTTPSRDGRIRLMRVTRTRRSRWPDEVYPNFELFAYVPGRAYERATGMDSITLGDAVAARGVESRFPFLSPRAQPDGEAWDFDDRTELLRRLPRLARHHGITAGPDDSNGDKAEARWLGSGGPLDSDPSSR